MTRSDVLRKRPCKSVNPSCAVQRHERGFRFDNRVACPARQFVRSPVEPVRVGNTACRDDNAICGNRFARLGNRAFTSAFSMRTRPPGLAPLGSRGRCKASTHQALSDTGKTRLPRSVFSFTPRLKKQSYPRDKPQNAPYKSAVNRNVGNEVFDTRDIVCQVARFAGNHQLLAAFVTPSRTVFNRAAGFSRNINGGPAPIRNAFSSCFPPLRR